MNDQDIVFDTVHQLVPEVCEFLGENKVRLVIADVSAADGRAVTPSFAKPEHGHPSDFAGHIKTVAEWASIILVLIKAYNRAQEIRNKPRHDDPDNAGKENKVEQLKSAIIEFLRNIK